MAPELKRRTGAEASLAVPGVDAAWRIGLAARIVNRRQQIKRPDSLDDDADGSGKARAGQGQQQSECFNRSSQVKPPFAVLRSRHRLEAG
ncbi:hypothetical protein MKX08_004523 [Trichoderma sp. CBMAI-0020]|nr:hypothetical protein MKX08_004523 [Trichoderma sp. CBMAI-0020]